MICVLLLVAAVAADVTEEQYSSFPRLFHLDDYERCLARQDGVYCAGTFHLTAGIDSALYRQLEDYSSDQYNFNRTLLHRGYCLTTRCPSTSSLPPVQRFERCVSHWSKHHGLSTTLQKLHYCHEHGREREDVGLPELVFLACVGLVVLVNVVGTVYDVMVEDSKNKSRILTAWSIRTSWGRLTATYEHGDPRLSALAPVQGIRVFILMVVMLTHAGHVHHLMYLHNPQYLETLSRHWAQMIFQNGTCVVQAFIGLSSFLLAYNLLLQSHDRGVALSFKHLPKILINRILRLTPVNLLVIGFASTWWARWYHGPHWSLLLEPEAATCRKKFWSHALFVNNLVEPDQHCIIPSWFLAVDTQLYVVAAVLTLLLSRSRRALLVLALLVLGSSVTNALLAWRYQWQPLLYVMYRENIRTSFVNAPSFAGFYTSPWGSLPACLIGVFTAFLHFQTQLQGFQADKHRWLVYMYHLAIPFNVLWIMSGNILVGYTSPLFTSIYAGVERPVFVVVSAVFLFGMINKLEGPLKAVSSWRCWQPLGRMSLSVLLLHWCCDVSLAASRPALSATSLTEMSVDFFAVLFYSYSFALPTTLLLDMPVQTILSMKTNTSPPETKK